MGWHFSNRRFTRILELETKMHNKDQDFYRRRYLADVWNYGNKKINFLNKLFLPTKELAYSLLRRMLTKCKIDDCDYVWYNWIRRTKTFLNH